MAHKSLYMILYAVSYVIDNNSLSNIRSGRYENSFSFIWTLIVYIMECVLLERKREKSGAGPELTNSFGLRLSYGMIGTAPRRLSHLGWSFAHLSSYLSIPARVVMVHVNLNIPTTITRKGTTLIDIHIYTRAIIIISENIIQVKRNYIHSPGALEKEIQSC